MRGAILGLALTVCAGSAVPAQEAAPLTRRVDFSRRAARFDLPGRLNEVSGLALDADGMLLAHDDERARVFRLDATTGDVDRGFYLGDAELRGDFEGIARAGDRYFLVASTGGLYEFRMAPEGERAPVRITDTGLGASCEIEGLAFHEASESLLIACKSVAPRADEIRIHRLPLDPDHPALPPIRTPFSALEPWGLRDGFHASGIAVDPATGTLILIAARQEAIVELDLEGHVVSGLELSRNRHPQPEGIEVGVDGSLYIADEANGRDARLTVYAPVMAVGRR